jgi:uncharacterized protein
MAKEPGVRIEVRVHPQAKRSRITGMLGGAYKLDVAAPATDGRANDACIELLAEITGIARKNICLLKGQTSRSKIFEFEGGDEVELQRRLDQAI